MNYVDCLIFLVNIYIYSIKLCILQIMKSLTVRKKKFRPIGSLFPPGVGPDMSFSTRVDCVRG